MSTACGRLVTLVEAIKPSSCPFDLPVLDPGGLSHPASESMDLLMDQVLPAENLAYSSKIDKFASENLQGRSVWFRSFVQNGWYLYEIALWLHAISLLRNGFRVNVIDYHFHLLL